MTVDGHAEALIKTALALFAGAADGADPAAEDPAADDNEPRATGSPDESTITTSASTALTVVIGSWRTIPGITPDGTGPRTASGPVSWQTGTGTDC